MTMAQIRRNYFLRKLKAARHAAKAQKKQKRLLGKSWKTDQW